jgi:hypothetical protein
VVVARPRLDQRTGGARLTQRAYRGRRCNLGDGLQHRGHIIEVMDIRDGLIRHHRVYSGWYSFRLIKTGQHPG